MKHKPENKETIYDEENEMVERGFGTRRDPEHLRHLGYQHWANEKRSILGMRTSKKGGNY